MIPLIVLLFFLGWFNFVLNKFANLSIAPYTRSDSWSPSTSHYWHRFFLVSRFYILYQNRYVSFRIHECGDIPVVCPYYPDFTCFIANHINASTYWYIHLSPNLILPMYNWYQIHPIQSLNFSAFSTIFFLSNRLFDQPYLQNLISSAGYTQLPLLDEP